MQIFDFTKLTTGDRVVEKNKYGDPKTFYYTESNKIKRERPGCQQCDLNQDGYACIPCADGVWKEEEGTRS